MSSFSYSSSSSSASPKKHRTPPPAVNKASLSLSRSSRRRYRTNPEAPPPSSTFRRRNDIAKAAATSGVLVSSGMSIGDASTVLTHLEDVTDQTRGIIASELLRNSESKRMGVGDILRGMMKVGVKTTKQRKKKGKAEDCLTPPVSSSTASGGGSGKEMEIPVQMTVVKQHHHYHNHELPRHQHDQNYSDYRLKAENESMVSSITHEPPRWQAAAQRKHQQLPEDEEDMFALHVNQEDIASPRNSATIAAIEKGRANAKMTNTGFSRIDQRKMQKQQQQQRVIKNISASLKQSPKPSSRLYHYPSQQISPQHHHSYHSPVSKRQSPQQRHPDRLQQQHQRRTSSRHSDHNFHSQEQYHQRKRTVEFKGNVEVIPQRSSSPHVHSLSNNSPILHERLSSSSLRAFPPLKSSQPSSVPKTHLPYPQKSPPSHGITIHHQQQYRHQQHHDNKVKTAQTQIIAISPIPSSPFPSSSFLSLFLVYSTGLSQAYIRYYGVDYLDYITMEWKREVDRDNRRGTSKGKRRRNLGLLKDFLLNIDFLIALVQEAILSADTSNDSIHDQHYLSRLFQSHYLFEPVCHIIQIVTDTLLSTFELLSDKNENELYYQVRRVEEELILEKSVQIAWQNIDQDIHEAVYYMMEEYTQCRKSIFGNSRGGSGGGGAGVESSSAHTSYHQYSYSSPPRAGDKNNERIISPSTERSPSGVADFPDSYNPVDGKEGGNISSSSFLSREELAIKVIVELTAQLWKERLVQGVDEDQDDIQTINDWLEKERRRDDQMRGGGVYVDTTALPLSRHTLQQHDIYADSGRQEGGPYHNSNSVSDAAGQGTNTSTKVDPYHHFKQLSTHATRTISPQRHNRKSQNPSQGKGRRKKKKSRDKSLRSASNEMLWQFKIDEADEEDEQSSWEDEKELQEEEEATMIKNEVGLRNMRITKDEENGPTSTFSTPYNHHQHHMQQLQQRNNKQLTLNEVRTTSTAKSHRKEETIPSKMQDILLDNAIPEENSDDEDSFEETNSKNREEMQVNDKEKLEGVIEEEGKHGVKYRSGRGRTSDSIEELDDSDEHITMENEENEEMNDSDIDLIKDENGRKGNYCTSKMVVDEESSVDTNIDNEYSSDSDELISNGNDDDDECVSDDDDEEEDISTEEKSKDAGGYNYYNGSFEWKETEESMTSTKSFDKLWEDEDDSKGDDLDLDSEGDDKTNYDISSNSLSKDCTHNVLSDDDLGGEYDRSGLTNVGEGNIKIDNNDIQASAFLSKQHQSIQMEYQQQREKERKEFENILVMTLAKHKMEQQQQQEQQQRERREFGNILAMTMARNKLLSTPSSPTPILTNHVITHHSQHNEGVNAERKTNLNHKHQHESEVDAGSAKEANSATNSSSYQCNGREGVEEMQQQQKRQKRRDWESKCKQHLERMTKMAIPSEVPSSVCAINSACVEQKIPESCRVSKETISEVGCSEIDPMRENSDESDQQCHVTKKSFTPVMSNSADVEEEMPESYNMEKKTAEKAGLATLAIERKPANTPLQQHYVVRKNFTLTEKKDDTLAVSNELEQGNSKTTADKYSTDGHTTTIEHSPHVTPKIIVDVDGTNLTTAFPSNSATVDSDTSVVSIDDGAEIKRIKAELMQSRQRVKKKLQSLRVRSKRP